MSTMWLRGRYTEGVWRVHGGYTEGGFWWERFRRGGVKFGWKGGVEKSSAKGLRLPSHDFRTPP